MIVNHGRCHRFISLPSYLDYLANLLLIELGEGFRRGIYLNDRSEVSPSCIGEVTYSGQYSDGSKDDRRIVPSTPLARDLSGKLLQY